MGRRIRRAYEKKALTCIKKMLNFYQEARGVLGKRFTLITDDQINLIFTLIKARGLRLDKEEKERQTSNIVDRMREAHDKISPMEEAFNACEQPAVKKILRDIVRIGKGVEDGTLRCICRRSFTEIRDLRYRMRIESRAKDSQEEDDDEEGEDDEAAVVETEDSGQKFAKISLQNKR